MSKRKKQYLLELLEDIPEFDPTVVKKAEEDDSFAQLDIGEAYCLKADLPDNYEKAFYWLSLAGKQRNMKARFLMGDLYALGKGTEKDEFTAYQWYMKSAIQGYPKALTRLHNLYHSEKSMYCRGQRSAEEEEWTQPEFKEQHKIRELFEYRVEQMASELTKTKVYFTELLHDCRKQDTVDAYLTLGFLYQHGYGIRKITSRAIEFYTLAADKGSTDAQYNLASIYHAHHDMKWNYREAFKWYTKAAENGSIYAQSGFALLYQHGLGVDIDYEKTIYWYTQAAEMRNVKAMISLASIYRKGKIVGQDYDNAKEWYKRAVKEGSQVAQNCLNLFDSNNSAPSNDKADSSLEEKAPKRYFKKGLCSKLRDDVDAITVPATLKKFERLASNAMKKDGNAMLEIGLSYYHGTQFQQDKDTAFRWIRKAAKAGAVKAKCSIAELYKSGDCVEQDYLKSSIWYTRAAKNRDRNAQYQLGQMYYHGLGVRKDPLEASKWYTFAADKNNSDAQCQLGILRERGEGLSQNIDEATKLYYEAIKQKNPYAIYKIAQMYDIGGGLENNAELAMELFGVAARLGDLDAQLKLAKIYGDDKNQHHDTKTSFKFYQMAAEQGSPYAKYKLAILYLDGQGTDQDFIQAYYLFKECSNLGYHNAINIFNIPIDYSKSSDIDYRKVSTMFMTVCDKEIDSLEYNFGRLYSQNFRFHCGKISTLITASPSLKKAWYERAVKKGNPMALYELGIFYEKSETQDHPDYTDYFQRAYENGSIDATYKLATLYLHGHRVSQDLRKTFTLLNKAADMGHKDAHQILNNFNYDNGEDIHETIKKMLEISAESGHVLSQYKLGALASDTKSPYYNTREAIKWFERASNGGFVNAHYQLGLLLELGSSSEKEQQKVISLYRMAGDKGHEKALFRLAQVYHHGANRDYAEAFRLYTLAAQQEYQAAKLATCVLSELMWEEKRNQLRDDLMLGGLGYSSYLQMWEVVADQGDVELQYILGKMYEQVGTDSSLSQAAKWYFRAAENVHTLAVYHLGRLYETGRGVDQDYLQSNKYYKIARNLGNRDALYQLGMIYQHGKEISPNGIKAIDYYTQAAEKGNIMAQFTLGQLFEEGKLLSKNILESVRWYSISSSHGNKKSQAWLRVYYDEPHSTKAFYKRLYRILSRIVNISSNSNRRSNNELLGEVSCKLGLMYLYGYGTKLDYKEALSCFRESTKLCANDTARFFSNIIYKDIPASLTKKYLKSLEMFESVAGQAEQLDLEDIYELGLIYYHGVNSMSEGANTNETRIIINSDPANSSKYFRMIVKGQLSADELYTSSSYYLGMIHFIDVETGKASKRAGYYLTHAFNSECSDAKALLNYIKEEETDTTEIFKQVFNWHKDNQNIHLVKITFNIGWMYYKGFGTDQDYTNALYYIGLAVDRHYTDAQRLLGYFYEKGYGTAQNLKEAITWYEKAAKQNNLMAIYSIGNIHYNGNGVEVNYRLAFQHYQIAADRGHVDSQVKLGVHYANGHGVDQDWAKAIEWYTKAANQNSADASLNLGAMYYYGRGVKMNYQLAFKHFQTAAKKGYAKAQTQLGFFYANGYGTAQDTTKAIEWYTKAVDQNSGDASLNLGVMYYYGRCIGVDYQLAFQHFQTASNQGNAPAQIQLAVMYHRGLGVEKNSDMALKLCSSIPNKNGDVRCLLGEVYHSANTQCQDFSKALECYKQTVGRQENCALRGLGLLYEHGDGVDKDYEKALEFYTQSGDKGNKGGYYNIALLYYYGKGVAQDSSASFGYFKRVLEGEFKEHNTHILVEEGSESNSHSGQQKKYSYVSERIVFGEAHFYLGIMNEKGQGTSQDNEKALYHFKFSHSLGIDRAKTFLEIQ